VQCNVVHNNSCIHDPWDKLSGFPKDGIQSAGSCCSLCKAAAGCVSWSFYGSSCNAFHSISSRAKLNPGDCVSGGTLPLPPGPPPPPKPPPPPPPPDPPPSDGKHLHLLELNYSALLRTSCAATVEAVPSLPTDAAHAFLQAYRSYNGSVGSNETAMLSAASLLLAQPDVHQFLSRPDSFAAGGLDFSMVRCHVLNTSTPLGLAQFAAKGSAQEELVSRLLNDGLLMRDMLVAGGASGGKYGEAMQIYESLLNASKVLHTDGHSVKTVGKMLCCRGIYGARRTWNATIAITSTWPLKLRPSAPTVTGAGAWPSSSLSIVTAAMRSGDPAGSAGSRVT
jgi:hypothetical protein